MLTYEIVLSLHPYLNPTDKVQNLISYILAIFFFFYVDGSIE